MAAGGTIALCTCRHSSTMASPATGSIRSAEPAPVATVPRRASTSISMRIRSSASPHTIIVAAGRTCPNALRSTGQQGSKSSRAGNR